MFPKRLEVHQRSDDRVENYPHTEERGDTLALHRLNAIKGFDIGGEHPRRRHMMEDMGLRMTRE